jgi:hypothetical protein
MTSTQAIEKMLEEARDGDLVKLVLKENNIVKVKRTFIRKNFVRITIGLEKLVDRPRYGYGESGIIESVVGYYGQWFREDGKWYDEKKDISKMAAIIYPMAQENLALNSEPPIRLEVPLREIASYEIIKKGEKPVTPPSAFP